MGKGTNVNNYIECLDYFLIIAFYKSADNDGGSKV